MEHDWIEQRRREAQDRLRTAEQREREAAAATGDVFTPYVNHKVLVPSTDASHPNGVIFRVERDDEGVPTLHPVDSSYTGYELPPGVLAAAQEMLRAREEVKAHSVPDGRFVFRWSMTFGVGYSTGGAYEFEVMRDEDGKVVLVPMGGRRSSLE
jgi:hypothetical protein